MKPLLTIAIPTYNRCELLRKTLEAIVCQKSDQVEIVVSNNCSSDDTITLASIFPSIMFINHESSIGGDTNILFSLTQGTGEYIWPLCDDDLPKENAISHILEAIRRYGKPGLINIDAIPSDKDLANYSPKTGEVTWMELSKDEFLERIGDKLTFVSSIIARRDLVDVTYLEKMRKLSLVAVGANLSAASEGTIIMPSQPLLYMRGGNCGGYDAYTVFSKNLSIALKTGRKYGFSKRSLDKVYEDSLSGVMCYIVSVWPLTLNGIMNLVFYSFRYKNFYRKIFPLLASSLKRRA